MVKVLLAGDVAGRLGTLHARVAALNGSSHGPFDVVFCVGRFFSVEGEEDPAADLGQYLSGEKSFPIPVTVVPGNLTEEALRSLA